jgi:hypothetical protein
VLSRAAIRQKCAFTYMNATSRRNLSGALTAEMNRARNGPGKGGALDSVTGIALSRRMIVTCMWGVSDPLRAARGAKKGAARWGSLTPPRRPARLRQRRGLRNRRHRTPPASDRRPLTDKNIGPRLSRTRRRAPRATAASQCRAGERCSRVSVPPPCSPPLESRHGQPGRAKAAV